MPFDIENKLVVAVSSSAVFNMTEADAVFQSQGETAYREYQRERIDEPFTKGVAFPFIRRLLKLNQAYRELSPIEVIVLSRNDPDSGQRFFRSCRHYNLDITRGAFLDGKSPYRYIPAFNASLFLSANKKDVKKAIAAGMPAGLVMPTEVVDNEEENELRVAFDFDGVIADDESEAVYQADPNDMERYQAYEQAKRDDPHNPGPLADLLRKMSAFQKWEKNHVAENAGKQRLLRVAIVTARNAPANERLITTLNAWGLEAVELFLMGGIEKRRVLDVLQPHIFFEDQLKHLATAAATVPSVHIPFGVTNQPKQEGQS